MTGPGGRTANRTPRRAGAGERQGGAHGQPIRPGPLRGRVARRLGVDMRRRTKWFAGVVANHDRVLPQGGPTPETKEVRT